MLKSKNSSNNFFKDFLQAFLLNYLKMMYSSYILNHGNKINIKQISYSLY